METGRESFYLTWGTLQSCAILQVPIGVQEDFMLSLIGEVGDGFQGDIAIDDLNFVDCRAGTASSSRKVTCTKCPSLPQQLLFRHW